MMGEAAYDTFRTKCIEGNMSQICFHERLPKLKLKTFTGMHKSGRKVGSNQVTLNTDRKLFGHMILVAENRKLDLKELLSHPLGPLPWSLACGDGSLRKTDKSTLAKEIIKVAEPSEAIPDPKANIIDGMALIHKLKVYDKTFSELANSVLSHVL